MIAALCLALLQGPGARDEGRPELRYRFAALAGSAYGYVDARGPEARFRAPEGIAVDRHGNVYVTEYWNSTVRKIAPDGTVSTLGGRGEIVGSADGPLGTSLFGRPHGLAVSEDLTVYVSDMGNHTIRKISPAGEVSTLAGKAGEPGTADGTGPAARFFKPEGIAVDANGTLYVADTYNYTVRKITKDGRVTTLAGRAGSPGAEDGRGPAGRFNMPLGVAVDGAGIVYVADADFDGKATGNCLVRTISPEGDVRTLSGRAGSPGGADGKGPEARFTKSVGIAVSRGGIVFVADTGAHTIRRISPRGDVTTVGGVFMGAGEADGIGPVARFNSPQAIAVDEAGVLYIADTGNHRVRKGVPGEPVRPDTAIFGTDAGPAGSVGPKQKHLINWPQSAVIGAPPNLLARWDYIETLPFDGVVIFTPDFREVMTPGKTVTYQKVFTDSKLGELATKFKRVKNNFLMIWAAPAPLDAFDNWDGIVANFAAYARAAKNAGCLGVVFDNEQYRGGIWSYPKDVLHPGSYSLEQYRAQMRLRGRQIMAAMISEFPDIQFMSAHGPYWSEPQAYAVIRSVSEQLPPNTGNLAGAFLSGIVEASAAARAQGSRPKYIDGGELYSMRTREEFSVAYTWRKHTVASSATTSPNIPEPLRPDWAKTVSISFGLYNLPFYKPMNPAILRTTLEHSLREADDLVWFYSDGMDWYTPGSVSQAWIDAAREGFKAGTKP